MWLRKNDTMWVKKGPFPPLGTFWITPAEVEDRGGILYQRVENRTKRFRFEESNDDEILVSGFEDPEYDGCRFSKGFLQWCTPDELSCRLPDAIASQALELWFEWHRGGGLISRELKREDCNDGRTAEVALLPTPKDKPFRRSYSVVPGKLWGGCYPGDKDPEVATQKLNGLLDCGIGLVVNLMEQGERGHGGEAFEPYEPTLQELAIRTGRSVRVVRHPIPDACTPSAREMVQILNTIDDSIERGIPVFVHCWGGKGRTGTVIGCYLARNGIAFGRVAMDKIRELREKSRDPKAYSKSPATPEQIAMVQAWPRQRDHEGLASND
jgi:hypothetical protein